MILGIKFNNRCEDFHGGLFAFSAVSDISEITF